jgi:hypothetical protein
MRHRSGAPGARSIEIGATEDLGPLETVASGSYRADQLRRESASILKRTGKCFRINTEPPHSGL